MWRAVLGAPLPAACVVIVAILAVGLGAAAQTSDALALGRLTLVEAGDDVPYAYWYYVPETAVSREVVGLVWHATPGGTQPDDPIFWAGFDLSRFLACSQGHGRPRVDLPETYGLVLFSIAVP